MKWKKNLNTNSMKTHPILFSTEMVQAILAGRKTQTRRVMKPQPSENVLWSSFGFSTLTPENHIEGRGNFPEGYGSKFFKLKYGKPGDLLWVRESFVKFETFNETLFSYKASPKTNLDVNWKPSIHMPKDACRIWLRITNIRIERLKNITEEDAIAEGVENITESKYGFLCKWNDSKTGDTILGTAQTAFSYLWKSINGEQSWNENPFVWVVEFEVLSTTGFNAIAEDIRKEVNHE